MKDITEQAPSISELKTFLSSVNDLFHEAKDQDPEGIPERADLVEQIIKNSLNDIKNVPGGKNSIDDLPIDQQARLFANVYCLQGIFFGDLNDFDEDEEEFEEESYITDEDDEES